MLGSGAATLYFQLFDLDIISLLLYSQILTFSSILALRIIQDALKRLNEISPLTEIEMALTEEQVTILSSHYHTKFYSMPTITENYS